MLTFIFTANLSIRFLFFHLKVNIYCFEIEKIHRFSSHVAHCLTYNIYFHLNLLKTTTTIIFVKYICQWIKNLLLWNCVFLSSSPPVFLGMRICLFSLKSRSGRQYFSLRYFGLLGQTRGHEGQSWGKYVCHCDQRCSFLNCQT